MSKKNRKRSREIPGVRTPELPRTNDAIELPRTDDALEVPNYVIPTTDLEYKQTVNGTRNPEKAQDCGENCGNDCGDARNCGDDCGENCKN